MKKVSKDESEFYSNAPVEFFKVTYEKEKIASIFADGKLLAIEKED